MNTMLILVLCLFALCVIFGYWRGFLKKILITGSVILSVYIGSAGYGMVSKWIQQNTSLTDTISMKIETVLLDKTQKEISTKVDQIDAIDEIAVPESVRNALLQNNNKEVYEKLGVTDFYDYVSHFLSCCIINSLCYVGIMIATFLFIIILFKCLDIMTDFPLVNAVNHVGGAVMGVFEGVLLVWILLSAVTIMGMAGIAIGQTGCTQIEENVILSAINNHNLILHIIMNIAKVLY